jgi:hypothetical protein
MGSLRRSIVRILATCVLAGLMGTTGLPPTPASSQTIPYCQGHVSVTPTSGPAGTAVTIKGNGFCQTAVGLSFTDAMGTYTSLGGWPTHFTAYVTIPSNAAPGVGTITALDFRCGRGRLCFPVGSASTVFTVTAGASSRTKLAPFTAARPSGGGVKSAEPIPSTIKCVTRPPAAANVMLNCPSDSDFVSPETTIAVDPADPLHAVAVSFDGDAFPGASPEFYTTFDGGTSWTVGDAARQGAQRVTVDPSVAFDAKHGTVIYSMFDFEATPTTACDVDQIASVSGDGGLTWGAPVEVGGGTGCQDGPNVGYDKPWVVVDNHPASPHYGRAYLTTALVTCTKVDCGVGDDSQTFEIALAHSDDGGYAWSALEVINGSNPTFCTAPPDPPRCDSADFASPTVSPDGSVHVAFETPQNQASWEPGECCENEYMVVNSSDGGATWSNPVHVADLEDGSRDYPNCFAALDGSAYCTLSGKAQINAPAFGFGNLVGSPIDGTLYLVFADNRNGVHDSDNPLTNSDVFLMTSTDGGDTWAGPDIVTDAPGDQFMPYADVNPVTGDLGVVFYDRGYGSADLFDVTLATGSKESFTSTRITTNASHFDKNLWLPARVPGCEQCAAFIGDYIGLAYGSDGTANISWTDLRRKVAVQHLGGGYTENVFFAKA